jgi:hypothetical protein
MTDDRVSVLDRDKGVEIWSRDDIQSCRRQTGNNLVQFRHPTRCKYLGKFDLGFALVPADPPLLLGHNPEDGNFVLIDASSGRTIYESDHRALGKVVEYSYSDSQRQFVMLVETGNERYAFASLGADGRPGWRFETNIVKDLVWLGEPHEASILVYGKDRDDKRLVAEIDLKTGRTAWQATGLLNEDIEDGPRLVGNTGGRWRQKPYSFTPPIADSDSSVVVFLTKDGPHRISRDGNLLWKSPALTGKKPSPIQIRAAAVSSGGTRESRRLPRSSPTPAESWCGRTRVSSCSTRGRERRCGIEKLVYQICGMTAFG